MALLYRTSLVPSKLELLQTWVPKQPWFVGDEDAELVSVASFRFDDPDGEVGVETLLVCAGDGPVLQVPLTYRNEERAGSQDGFIGTMEHGVLGTRWVYDATSDPVYQRELARVILTGGTQVDQWIETEGVMTEREPTARVVGSGSETRPDLLGVAVEIVRVPGGEGSGPLVLTGTWTEHPEPTVLAIASVG